MAEVDEEFSESEIIDQGTIATYSAFVFIYSNGIFFKFNVESYINGGTYSNFMATAQNVVAYYDDIDECIAPKK